MRNKHRYHCTISRKSCIASITLSLPESSIMVLTKPHGYLPNRNYHMVDAWAKSLGRGRET